MGAKLGLVTPLRLRRGVTMERFWSYWRGVPAGAKVAVSALIVGWILHAAVYVYSFPVDINDRTVWLQLVVGVGICYGVATGRRWARMLCVFFNIGIIALYALYSLALFHSEEGARAGLTALIAATFALSAVFLLTRDSARFFNPPAPFTADDRKRHQT